MALMRTFEFISGRKYKIQLARLLHKFRSLNHTLPELYFGICLSLTLLYFFGLKTINDKTFTLRKVKFIIFIMNNLMYTYKLKNYSAYRI
jgi:hypothetical protein